MKLTREQTWVALGALVWAGVLAAQGWWLHDLLLRTARAELVLKQHRAELAQRVKQSPALNQETADALAADLARATAQEVTFRGQWISPDQKNTPVPASTMDAYFAIAATVNELRQAAARERVRLPEGERFGFASHAQAGPDERSLAVVHRQLVVVRSLVEQLIAARPQALLSVRRERPPAAGRDAGPSTESAQDFFVPPPQLSLAAPGVAATESYRIEFVGHTEALRTFLNALAASPWPLAVRSVEVERVAAERAMRSPSPAAADAPATVPIVDGNLSRFAVVVERIVPLEPAPAVAP
jgi:hypothetical protein